jgi:hypothetical protein
MGRLAYLLCGIHGCPPVTSETPFRVSRRKNLLVSDQPGIGRTSVSVRTPVGRRFIVKETDAVPVKTVRRFTAEQYVGKPSLLRWQSRLSSLAP